MNIQVFSKKKFGQMRGYAEGNTVYLNVADVAVGLGFLNNDGSIRFTKINHLLKKFKYPAAVSENDYIPENMFYRLAMKADNPNAEDFQGWLADKVIPSIRQSGTYSVNRTAAVPALPSPAIRQANIDTRKRFTSTLQIYINYAKRQGDYRESDRIYSKFTTLANQTVGIPKGERPKSDDPAQQKCSYVESRMTELFLSGMDDKKAYWRIEDEVIQQMNDLKSCFKPSLPLLE